MPERHGEHPGLGPPGCSLAVCDSCGKISDVYADFTDVRLPRGQLHGFHVSSTEIVFRGRCPECAAAGGPLGADESQIKSTNDH